MGPTLIIWCTTGVSGMRAPAIGASLTNGTSLATSAAERSRLSMPHALPAEARRRSSCCRACVRATSIPPLVVNTPSASYCSVLSRVSSIIIFEYSIGKMKLDAWPVEPPGLGIGPLSMRTMSRQPSRARWYAKLLPTMPAPMTTALARLGLVMPLSSVRLSLDRDFLVDQAEVDPLPAAHEPRGHVDDDGQHVHPAHVVQRIGAVDEVAVVGEPLVEVEPEQPDRDNPGQRDDLHAENLDLASRRRSPQRGLAPRQDDDRDRAEQIGHRDDQGGVQRVGPEGRRVRVDGGQPHRGKKHQDQGVDRNLALLRHL